MINVFFRTWYDKAMHCSGHITVGGSQHANESWYLKMKVG